MSKQTETFGARMRRLRQERGMTVDELAANAGILLEQLCGMEADNGLQMGLPVYQLNELASALGVPDGDVLDESPVQWYEDRSIVIPLISETR